MANFIEIELEGEDVIAAKFATFEERQRMRLRGLLGDLAELGEALLRANAPRGIYRGGRLHRAIDSSGASWRPGGVGGGGEYQSVFGVKGPSIYPYYVEFGTGLYGPKRNYIYPNRSPFMSFYSTLYKRWVTVARTRGQRPQRFFYITWREFQVYAAARLMMYHPFA
jgi:hypothetical protein